MHHTFAHNLRLIDSLNQRGGRMLSLADLLDRRSVHLEMAAYLLQQVRAGASFITAARPGAAGKTAVVGALLGCIPSTGTIQIVETPRDLQKDGDTWAKPVWHVCHELGPGNWFGYLWGRDVADYFKLIGRQSHIATNLHADTLDEVRSILMGSAIGVAPEDFSRLDLLLTLRMSTWAGNTMRWVNAIYAPDDSGGHHLVYGWDPATETLQRGPGAPERQSLATETELLKAMVAEGVLELSSFNKRLVEVYS